MDVGASNGWKMDEVISSAEVIKQVHAVFPLEAIDANYPGEVAERWRYLDGSGEIGVISSVTQAFCHSCSRARLSTDGKLYTCLFAQQGHEVRQYLRNGMDDAGLLALFAGIWQGRRDNYSEIRTADTASLRKVEMSYIGG
jgi:cyclic pyranopterin phosphate synthase